MKELNESKYNSAEIWLHELHDNLKRKGLSNLALVVAVSMDLLDMRQLEPDEVAAIKANYVSIAEVDALREEAIAKDAKRG